MGPEPFMSPRATAQLPYTGAGTGFPISPEGSRKRPRSPSDDFRDNSRSSRGWSTSTLASSPRRSPSRGPSALMSPNNRTPDARGQFPTHHMSPRSYMGVPPNHRTHSGSESSESEDEPDPDSVIHSRIVREVDILIQKDPTWAEYFKASAQPRSAAAVLKEYGIVQGKFIYCFTLLKIINLN
jgi:hypothetical protein